jgi:NAD(P)-dependent dehydrogenase (short-subunit alcohol dehydrogenase family)
MEKRFLGVSKQDLEKKVTDVDLKSISGLSQATVRLMINNDTTSREAGGLITEITSTPAIAGDTASVHYSIPKSGVTAITKHVVLERGNKNNRAYSLALGNISTGATFACLTLIERKKGAMENSMKVWATQETLPQLV